VKKKNIAIFLKRLWGKAVVRLITSLCILAVLIANLPLRDLWHTVKQISPLIWVFVLAVFIGGHILGVAKWSLFINMGQKRLPFLLALRCYFAGLFANIFLPSIAGGDVVRAGLAIRYKGEKETVIIAGIADRFLDVSALGLIILMGALYHPAALALEDRMVFSSLVIAVLIFTLSILVLLYFPFLNKIPKPLKELIERLQDIIRQLIRRPQRALVAFVLAVFIQSLFVVLNAKLGSECQIDLPLHIWFVVWPLAKLSAMLPIGLGGLGVRETALAVLLARFHIPFSRSVGLGLLWESILITGGGMGGIFYALSRKKNSRPAIFVEQGVTRRSKAVI
jgi:uncharacterized protein (TIRG00374 family)